MLVTQERVKEVFDYNPDTGVFIRKLRTGNNNGCKVGKPVGADCHGYLSIGLDHKSYPLHRLAWLYMMGEWPKGHIDHINGNRSDNRFCNLRDVPQKINAQNYHQAQKNNKCGFLGVYHASGRSKKWRAGINVNRKIIHLGYFSTPELAHEAYLAAKRKYHEGCTI